MNEMGLKEKALVAILGVIVLYAIAVGVYFLSAEKAWKTAARKYEKESDLFAKEEKLITERRRWEDAYESERAAMPIFKNDKATDTTWLRTLEEIAKTNLVFFTEINAGKEIVADDVQELPIEIKNLEGSLEALVKFMHMLENTDKGMFDIKSINLQPNKSKPGYLKGSLSLTCAYMREG